MTIQNRYNTYEYGGSKSVLLTTNSWVGGRNNFLGAAYITVGGLCFLTALAFFLAYNAGGCRRGGVCAAGFICGQGDQSAKYGSARRQTK